MNWKVRRLTPPHPTKPAALTTSDARLSDSSFRTYAWLLTKDDGSVLDPAQHGRQRGISAEAVHGHLEELVRHGLVKAVRTDENMEVVLMDPQEAYKKRQMVIDQAKLKHKNLVEKREEKKAASPKRWTPNREDVEPEQKKVRLVTSATLYDAWKDAWESKYPNVMPVAWLGKERFLAKKMIEYFGGERAVRAVALVFQNWESVASRYKLKGYPSIGWVVAYRETAVLELLEGKLVGTDAPMGALERSTKGAEYNANKRRAEDAEVGDWGD